MKKRSGAHVLVESLVNEGLTTIFGIPGVDTLSVYDAFLDHPSVRAINVRHEQSAVFMADGFYRASGNIGVGTRTLKAGTDQKGFSNGNGNAGTGGGSFGRISNNSLSKIWSIRK